MTPKSSRWSTFSTTERSILVSGLEKYESELRQRLPLIRADVDRGLADEFHNRLALANQLLEEECKS